LDEIASFAIKLALSASVIAQQQDNTISFRSISNRPHKRPAYKKFGGECIGVQSAVPEP